MTKPILYSFRRCPYAMRARLALVSAEQSVELREILLRDKAPEFLMASPKGTVPVMVLDDGTVLEESLDIMQWAFSQADPNGLDFAGQAARSLVDRCDDEFKPWLDQYKYPTRYEGMDRETARANASVFLLELNDRLDGQNFLFGDERSFADIGIAPFVRQFAHVDRNWFWDQDWPHLIAWLDAFLEWDGFKSIMPKFAKWESGDTPIQFP